jgi:hypothetical protein
VELSREIAERLLTEYPFAPPLASLQVDLIYQAILFHDKPQELAARGSIPAAVRVVCDVDHQWSFTHENFWQDTVRKGVAPPAYLENLAADLDSYFVAEPGKRLARAMLQERRSEVDAWQRWVAQHGA